MNIVKAKGHADVSQLDPESTEYKHAIGNDPADRNARSAAASHSHASFQEIVDHQLRIKQLRAYLCYVSKAILFWPAVSAQHKKSGPNNCCETQSASIRRAGAIISWTWRFYRRLEYGYSSRRQGQAVG